MLAKTSSCVDSLDIQNIKETAQKLRDKFCERHPEIQGKRRDQVKDIYYYAIYLEKYLIIAIEKYFFQNPR